MPTGQVNETQLLRRLEENDRLFSCRFRTLLAGTFRRIRAVTGEAQPKEKLLAIERAEQRRLEKFLADEVTAVFAIGEAHAALLCREKIKRFEKHKLSLFLPWFLNASDRRLVDLMNVDPKDFWLRPKEAIEAFRLRENMLAKDVSGALWKEVRPILAEHFEGVSRKETLVKLEKLQGVTERQAELIVTTESTYAYNRGRLAGFKKAEVDYVRFSAVMDARTSPQCRSRHGKVMRLGSAELAGNTPPLHGRCRSILSPIYSKYEPEEITPENTDWSKAAPLSKNWRTGGAAQVEKPVTPAPASDIIKGNKDIVHGQNVAGKWRRRPDTFKNEIEDVLNYQGFDGKPRLAKSKEFWQLVKEDHFVGQRAYSARTAKELAAYEKELRRGKWYVECKGGAQYGQGMYCAADFTKGENLAGLYEDMQAHIKFTGYANGKLYSKIETLTLDKSANILQVKSNKSNPITKLDLINDVVYSYVSKNPQLYHVKTWDEAGADLFKKILHDVGMTVLHKKRDVGAMAAELGYDAIKINGRGKSGAYVVILNRTKLILLEE